MRFGVIFIFLLMLVSAGVPSESGAHERGATQSPTAGIVAAMGYQSAAERVVAAERAAVVDASEPQSESPGDHHGDGRGDLKCHAVAGCGGTGALAKSTGLRGPRLMAWVFLDSPIGAPNGIDLPLEDRPPRSL